MARCLRPRRGDLKRVEGCSAAGEASEEPYCGIGPWAECAFGLFTPGEDFGRPSLDDGTAPGEDLARVPDCVCMFGGVLVLDQGAPNYGTRQVCPEKVDERAFLFVSEPCPY